MSIIRLPSEYDDLDKYKGYNSNDIWYCKKNTTIIHNPYGPAIIDKLYKLYYIDNKKHRLDGPAVIYSYARDEYWINNEPLTKEQFEVHPERLKFLGKGHLACLV